MDKDEHGTVMASALLASSFNATAKVTPVHLVEYEEQGNINPIPFIQHKELTLKYGF